MNITALRVSLLIQAADWRSKREGIDPRVEPERYAEQWELADHDEHWRLAELAGMSFDGRAAIQFIEALWARAAHLKGPAS